jgi:hypothetical protein
MPHAPQNHEAENDFNQDSIISMYYKIFATKKTVKELKNIAKVSSNKMRIRLAKVVLSEKGIEL